ncbi:putative tRNA (cytidine(32)/guanosine(34)-2'-O)-methyltransferase [Tanacetum coccineum]|uniref:Putative tRNA (cytidine(32)/guanosine(34)-2'-O)-methyltransferase n=1 Tax=Tanacetum coccineum TaxID=301880 RepID=A0ABQ5AV60_9ASTR
MKTSLVVTSNPETLLAVTCNRETRIVQVPVPGFGMVGLGKDIYYRKAKEEGWRARSAFKLLQIDEEFNIFEGVKHVVDLCAAPGSWSQCDWDSTDPSHHMCRDQDLPLIVAIDLQPMAPIEGVIQVQGDITNARTAEVVIRHFDGCKADLVVCDGAPDVTGLHDMDEFVQSQLILAGLTIVTHILKNGGKFIAKIFRGKDTSLLYCQLKLFFTEVTLAKPKSSRNSSIEAFAVCENYSPPEGFNEKDLHRLLEKVGTPSGADDLDCSSGWLEGPNKVYIPFLACGDLSGYDSDRSYPLPKAPDGSYKILDPVQPPIDPPYKRALEMKKASNHGV